MKKLFVLFLLTITVSTFSFACKCDFKQLTKADLNNFRYIALVKIKSFQPINLPIYYVGMGNHSLQYVPTTAKFSVEYIENFKGTMPKEFIMTAYNSSCDPGIREGEEWLLFSNEEEGYPIIHPCGFSVRYQDKNGEINKYYPMNVCNLDLVRANLKPSIFEKTGLLQEFYENKKAKFLERYNHSLLEGQRIFWYANGNVKGEESYKNGKRDGVAKWWFENGKPSSQAKYKDGILIDTSWVWQKKENESFKKTDSTYLKLFTIYKKGCEYNRRGYYDDGTLFFEQILLANGEVKFTNIWEKDGSLDWMSTDKWNKEKQEFEVEYQMNYRVDKDRRRVDYYNNDNDKDGKTIIYPSKEIKKR